VRKKSANFKGEEENLVNQLGDKTLDGQRNDLEGGEVLR